MVRFALLALSFASALVISSASAFAFETRAKAAYVLDYTTGTVLLSKDADVALPPASMSKLMTLYVAFEAVRSGRLKLDEELRVSRHAMNYGGSTLFLQAGERVKVEDLIRGIIVLSGNDACAVIAEALSPDGTEAGFARYMTERAKELGMTVYCGGIHTKLQEEYAREIGCDMLEGEIFYGAMRNNVFEKCFLQ